MQKLKPYIFGLLCLSGIAVANPAAQSAQYSFLAKGLDVGEYKKCQALVKKCPSDGPYLKQSCVDEVSKRNTICTQAEKLAKNLNTTIPFLDMKAVDNFTVATVNFPGDGKKHYYLVSPNGYVVDTLIDPRILDKSLSEKYEKASWVLLNDDHPQYAKEPDGIISFAVPLSVRENCAACAVVGTGIIKFSFSKEGNFLKAELKKFDAKNK